MTEPAEPAEPAEPVEVAAPRWGLGDAALAFLVGMLAAVLVDGIWVAVAGPEDTLPHTIVTLLALWVGLAGVPLWASTQKGTGSLATDYGLRFERQDVGLGIVVGVLSQFVLINIVVSLFQLLGPDVQVGEQAENLTNSAEGLGLALLAPFLVIGAPFVEETFFRGLVQRSLARRVGPGLAVVGSSIAFGLVHAQPNLPAWSQLALTTALGCFGAVLGVLAHRTGRLGPGIVAHMTFNTITFIVLALD